MSSVEWDAHAGRTATQPCGHWGATAHKLRREQLEAHAASRARWRALTPAPLCRKLGAQVDGEKQGAQQVTHTVAVDRDGVGFSAAAVCVWCED